MTGATKFERRAKMSSRISADDVRCAPGRPLDDGDYRLSLVCCCKNLRALIAQSKGQVPEGQGFVKYFIEISNRTCIFCELINQNRSHCKKLDEIKFLLNNIRPKVLNFI